MKEKQTKAIEIRADMEGFRKAQAFVEEVCRRHVISKQIISETMLVFEALFYNIAQQGFDEDTVLTIEEKRNIGATGVKIGFEGKMFVPVSDEADADTPENRILRAYDDKLECNYESGYNSIRITLKRSRNRSLVYCLAAFGLAILTYLVVTPMMEPDGIVPTAENLIYPIEKLFANGILMIAAPVTFFSMLKNMTDAFVVADRDSSLRKFQRIAIRSSVIVTLIAIVAAALMLPAVSGQRDILATYQILTLNMSFTRFLSSLVPSNIFEPFETISPFPLIFFAVVMAYSFVSVGKYFFSMKKGIDMFYTLFSRMLNVIMSTLPFFSYLAMLDLLMGSGPKVVFRVLLSAVLIYASLAFPAAFYLIRMKVAGVDLGAFLKKLPPLIKENIRINSVIDAVPYNIRYCAREFGFGRKRIDGALTALAQINLDGNCYLITLVSLLLLIVNNTEVVWADIILIGILVIFLSLGAPNQPGSITIGLLIITYYMHAYTLLPVVIFAEVLLGGLQNIFNVAGDIVAVAIDDAQAKRKAAAMPERKNRDSEILE